MLFAPGLVGLLWMLRLSGASVVASVSVSKDFILAEIRRTAEANGGTPLGRARFATETGIREHDWSGRYWARWNDAVAEAGLMPNSLQPRFDDDDVMRHLAEAVRRFGRMPTEPERRMVRREDPSFPSHGVFARFGGQRDQAARLATYCAQHPEYADVAAVIAPLLEDDQPEPEVAGPAGAVVFGAVYLLRVGKHYKLGRTNEFGRRKRELDIQLPERAQTVHVIRTDDPVGIEAYWHHRFRDRRANGEWFNLTAEDVAAFKRRKFM